MHNTKSGLFYTLQNALLIHQYLKLQQEHSLLFFIHQTQNQHNENNLSRSFPILLPCCGISGHWVDSRERKHSTPGQDTYIVVVCPNVTNLQGTDKSLIQLYHALFQNDGPAWIHVGWYAV